MRVFGAFALTALLWYPAGSIAGPAPISSFAVNPSLLLETKLVCGKFDGKFKCKNINDGTIGIEIGGDKHKENHKDNGKTNGNDAGGEGAGGGAAGNPADAGNAGGAGGGTPADNTEEAGACPEGYKRIDPPSKFGPCEPPEGLPNNAYVQCPPGATGTPPNCVCPGQSDYADRGNKCRHWSGACGTDKPGWNTPNFFCKVFDKIDCQPTPDGQEKCCCKKYD